MHFTWTNILLLNVLTCSYGARILGIFFCPSYSHQIVFQSIYKELSKRGHEVIVVTPNPLQDSSLINLTEIDVSYLYKYNENLLALFKNKATYSEQIHQLILVVNELTERILEDKEFKKMYQKAENEKFDLVLVEALTSMISAFGHVFNAPSIGIHSSEASLDKYSSLGGIIHPAAYGGMLTDFDSPLSLWHKIQNIYNFLWHKFYMKYVNEPVVDQLAKKYFGNDFPSIAELDSNISMLFVSKNMAMSSIRPMPPNIVLVDFLHVHEPKRLPKDLEQVLNNATQGVVYFSLGSNIKSSELPAPIRKSIIEGLSDLPYTVLWKWESDEVPDVSDNVITRKWFPQQDVLAHPNIKVFVTQGGLQSCDEAIARSVPVVGIPIIADQEDNVNKLIKLGVGVHLPLSSLDSDSLKKAIIEVVENKRYSERIKEIHNVCFDRPMTGLERAVWWSEYVIRHKGAPFLRSVIADMPLYQYLLLDVMTVVLIGLAMCLFILKTLVSTLRSVLVGVAEKKKLA